MISAGYQTPSAKKPCIAPAEKTKRYGDLTTHMKPAGLRLVWMELQQGSPVRLWSVANASGEPTAKGNHRSSNRRRTTGTFPTSAFSKSPAPAFLLPSQNL